MVLLLFRTNRSNEDLQEQARSQHKIHTTGTPELAPDNVAAWGQVNFADTEKHLSAQHTNEPGVEKYTIYVRFHCTGGFLFLCFSFTIA
mmetsp:Transcript_3197/g.12233  ORF Transcript_3197/g.12233 Transcript_3197/m.12233 type:complete len:89 (+) Transcript_3197:2237-2503(+)